MSKEDDGALRVNALARQISLIRESCAKDRAKQMLDLETKAWPVQSQVSIESDVLAHDLGVQKIYESLDEMCNIIESPELGSTDSKIALSSRIMSIQFWLYMNTKFRNQAISKDKKRKMNRRAEAMRDAKKPKSQVVQEIIKQNLDAYRAEHKTKAGAPAIAKEIVHAVNTALDEKRIDPIKWQAVRDRIYKADKIVGA